MLDSPCQIDLKDFKVLKTISQDESDFIILVEHNKEGQYAAKINLKVPPLDNTQFKKAMKRIEITSRIRHQTLNRFYGFSFTDFENQYNPTIIMDYVENGSLQELIENEKLFKSLSNTKKQILLIGIVRAMIILNSFEIIHGDLKPGNILIDKNCMPLISDYAFSQIYNPIQSENLIKIKNTLPYTAPEIFTGNDPSMKSDVYSFGIIMFQLLTGCTPYKEIIDFKDFNRDDFTTCVTNGLRPPFIAPIKESLKNLIIQCWSSNPDDRPTFQEIYTKLTHIPKKDEQDENYLLDDINLKKVRDYIETIGDHNKGNPFKLHQEYLPELFNAFNSAYLKNKRICQFRWVKEPSFTVGFSDDYRTVRVCNMPYFEIFLRDYILSLITVRQMVKNIMKTSKDKDASEIAESIKDTISAVFHEKRYDKMLMTFLGTEDEEDAIQSFIASLVLSSDNRLGGKIISGLALTFNAFKFLKPLFLPTLFIIPPVGLVLAIVGGVLNIANIFTKSQEMRTERITNYALALCEINLYLMRDDDTIINSNVLVTAVDERPFYSFLIWNSAIGRRNDGAWAKFLDIKDLQCAPKAVDHKNARLNNYLKIFKEITQNEDDKNLERIKKYMETK
ncbi:hypothetical protein M9Y10_000551 [Tritrichomonas musculus]|uniref:Protein kinase domain-containing protein n=1 Tax=Tritrichomonas musculus TaxID=1915356 RepID=A0ABR2L4K7_9EUKA